MIKLEMDMYQEEITKKQKDVIDMWQFAFPEKFPKKPAPKVFLTEDDVYMALDEAICVHGYSQQDAMEAMGFWRKGARYRAAEREARERKKSCLRQLAEDFPELFSPKAGIGIKLLKIGIHKDLEEWASNHGYGKTKVRKTLRNWVRSKEYRAALAEATKNGGHRYGLDLKEYGLQEGIAKCE